MWSCRFEDVKNLEFQVLDFLLKLLMPLEHCKLDDAPLSGTRVTLLVFDHLSLFIRDLCFAPSFI